MSCDKSSCVHGICVMIDGQGRCNCTHGYTGEYCDVPIQCKDGFCLNGGTCFEMLGRVECKCPSGFSGLNCERKTLEQTSAKGSPYEDKYLGIAASIFIFSFISGLAILAFVKYLQQRSQVRSKAPHELSANRADSPEQAEEYDVRPMSRDSLVGVQNFLLSRNMDARRSSAEAEDDWFKRRISAENPIARYGKRATQTDLESVSIYESEHSSGNMTTNNAGQGSDNPEKPPANSLGIRHDNGKHGNTNLQ